MEQAGVQLIAQGNAAYIGDLKNATSATNAFVDATEKGSGKVSGAGQVMIGALRKVGEIAVTALAQAAKATAAFVGDSIGLAGDFEQGMLNFQAVAGKDVDTKGLEQFRDLFLQIGKELPVSTAEVQQAATEMIKGGIDPAIVAAGGLRQNIQFAAAAMEGDLVAAAEISSKILGGWADASATAQQKADFLTHSTDLLTKAANASAVDVKGLSLGIFNAQGIAKTAGVSFDDLTTTLAELAPRFASSSEAGTSLKNLIARLQPTTKPAIAAMQGLGLMTEDGKNKFYDATGAFVGFESASQLLQDSLKGLTKQQQASILQTIFGNDAMSAASALAELGASGYTNMADAMAKANGVAENAALKQQGFNTAMDNAKGSVEALQITIGSALLPVLTDLINNVVAPGINTLTDMADAVFGNDEAFNRLSPTMQSIVSIIDLAIADTQEIIGAFDEAGAMSSEFGESIGLLASDLGLPGELIQDIVFAVQDVVKWFSSASDTSSDLGGAITDLSAIFDKALVVVTNVGNGYLAIAQSILPIVTRFWDEHGIEISAFIKGAYDKIMSIVNVALDLYNAIVPKALNGVAKWIDDHATGIQSVLSGAWEAISGIIDGALTLIEGALKIALDLINGDWSKAWTDLKSMSAAFVLDLEQVIEGFLNIIAGFFNTSLQEIADIWQHNWDMLVEIAGKVADKMLDVGRDIINGIISGIEDNAGKLMSTLKNLASDALQAAKDALGISSPSKEFAAVGEFAVTGIMKGFSDTWPQLTDLVGNLADGLTDKMKDIGSQMQDAIADGFGATASIDRQIAKNLDSFKNVLPEYQQYTTGALKAAQQEAESFADPAQGAKYFKMKSNQILEYAKLQKDLSDQQQAMADATNAQADEAAKLDEYRAQLAVASTQDEIDAIMKKMDASNKAADADRNARIEAQANVERINAQMLLINKAQAAELAQFDATKQAQSATQSLADQINAIMKQIAGIHLTDDQIKIVDMLSGVWASLVTPVQSRADAYAHPPQTQYPPTSTGGSTSTNNTNMNMSVYTNNSPAAIQQSWAVMQASMP